MWKKCVYTKIRRRTGASWEENVMTVVVSLDGVPSIWLLLATTSPYYATQSKTTCYWVTV